jgi:hypothetical protein
MEKKLFAVVCIVLFCAPAVPSFAGDDAMPAYKGLLTAEEIKGLVSLFFGTLGMSLPVKYAIINNWRSWLRVYCR